MSFTFLRAEGYDVGKSIVSLEHLGFAGRRGTSGLDQPARRR